MWKQPMSIYAVNMVKTALKPLLRAEVQKMNFRGRPLKPLLRAEVQKMNFRISSLTTALKPLLRAEVQKNGLNLYKEPRERDKKRYNIDTQKLDFSTANFSPAEIQKQNQDLVDHANDFLTDEDSGLPVFLEPEAVQLLSFFGQPYPFF